MSESVLVPSGEQIEMVQIPKLIFEDVIKDYQRLKIEEMESLHPEAGLPPRPPDIVHQIKLDEIEVQERAPIIHPADLTPLPPQGSIAPRVVRTDEQLEKIPTELRGIYLDEQSKRIPEWLQVARMFHRPHKKVAIVGFADTRDQAPYQDPTFEVWGLNDLHNWIPRYDRWFDIHSLENIDTDVIAGRTNAQQRSATLAGQPDFSNMGTNGLAKVNAPVYMWRHFDHIPNSIEFPVKEMVKEFGTYFTNSISWMLALAIFEGYEEIHIYGVDMAVGTEYVRQRPSVEYFLGIAKGRGIKVVIPPASDLLKTRFLYGFESGKQTEFDDKVRNMLKNMNDRLNMIRQQAEQARDASNQYQGAIGAIQEVRKIWSNLDEKDLVINDN